MSETLLDALMKLFALLTNARKESSLESARKLVRQQLLETFNQEYADVYLQRFNFYLQSFHKNAYSDNREEVEKQSNDNFDQIDRICEELNKELEKETKLRLFVQLFEFIRKEEKISEIGESILDRFAKGMLIDQHDFELLKTFILVGPLKVKDRESVLVISGDKEAPLKGFKHIYNDRQQVYVWVLYLASTHTFVFRYTGDRNLYLNGHKVEQNNSYIFSVGSVIRTSRMEPVYYGKVAELFVEREDKARILFRVRDVEYKFNDSQVGVQKFSFTGRSNQLIGIMGGSGAGKSTLLNVLNGNYKPSQGTISINGLDIHTHSEDLKGVIGYVPQEDLLIEELTVFENLYCNALLCFSDTPKDEVVEIVERAIIDFDLVEARDLVVGSPTNKVLSGGQRKRLNIALELIREPSILFVDEPTSGLSSMDSEKVMVLLKRQALKGKLVIINIHQPSSDLYKLIDKLLIIDRGGYIIYNGNVMDAIVYFKKQANYVNSDESDCQLCGNVQVEQPLRIIEARMVDPNGRTIRERKIKPVEWYKRYKQNIENTFAWRNDKVEDEKEELPKNLYNIPGRLKQFLIYTYRDGLSKFKDKQYVLINLLEAPILAVMIGYFTKFISGTTANPDQYVFSQNTNIPSYLFMAVIVALFLGLNLSAEEIIKDKKLLQREKFLNLSRSSYLNSKILVQFGISALQTFLLVVIGNYILEVQGLNFSYWLILFSTACFANILGLNISSGLKSVVAIYILIPLILVPQLLFSGVIVDYSKLHTAISHNTYVPRIGDMMASRWSYEALAVNQYKNNAYEREFFNEEVIISESSYYIGMLIPRIKQHNLLSERQWEDGKAEDALANRIIIDNALLDMKALVDQDTKESIESLLKMNHKLSESLFTKTESVLDEVKKAYQEVYKQAKKDKDDKYHLMVDNLGSNKAFNQFKHAYYNEKLADFLLDKSNMQKVKLGDERYIPLMDPILRESTSNYGRAHYFAPYKFFMGVRISTPLFNVIIIWLSTLLLYFTLYADLLSRVIRHFEKFKLRKAFRKNVDRV
ncbi:ATP-binding cassette domain-containing protein [Saccharicrinis aurantiacus]|uniref:ATP-binding cassette domain-containing protein n=1 Tax=Saccharicrinis aurantiacus TaxID=1849719 RepID=UPI00095022A2|nr:ATP-binding cassette domain-containing protein [Saccharicrinis aurantiacus]